jgi:hypothetical protein
LINKAALKDLVHQPALSNSNRLLLCLAADPLKARTVSDIKEVAYSAGLRKAKNWNVSAYLSGTKGLAIRTSIGWELTSTGQAHVRSIAGPYIATPLLSTASSLRSHLPAISSLETRTFVEEAIRCLEANLLRASVVLSWVGALSLLYDHVISRKLSEFNVEAKKKDPKWKLASSRDDLAKLKEHDFLQICHAISIIGKSVKDELETCLKLRNGCGHPNSLKIGELKVSAHVESLMKNVFLVF